MALSNWDCIAFTDKGKPSNGVFISPNGIKVEIYKNWVFISDKIAWQKKGGFAKPYVMKVYGGTLHYKDISIVSKFIDGTIYLIVWNGYSGEKLTGMVGIGTSGFGNNGRYYGVRKSQLKILRRIILDKDDDIPDVIPNEFRNIDLFNGKRFNQGDMFFSKRIGMPKQCTVVGNAKEPVFTKMLRK